MKKILVTFLLVFTLFGCSVAGTPTNKVEDYLSGYNSLSDAVVSDMETTIANENLSNENLATYREVLTRQYKDLKYKVKDEVVTGDDAVVKVDITVYDLHKSDVNSQTYMNTHLEEFNNADNVYDEELYSKYRLGEMLKATETVNYEVSFYLSRKDGEWQINDLNRDTLEKIHGLYNYDVD